MAKAKALTLEELRNLARQNDYNMHIWIEFIELETAYAAVVDQVDNVGLVAIWCAGDDEDWLKEATYGTEWRAYLEKPEISDRYNFVGAHLTGLED